MTQSIGDIPVDVYWSRLEASRLFEPSRVAELRREFERRGGKDGTGDRGSGAGDLAEWLHLRGILTAWQARRLLKGEKVPLVLGDYRLLERIETPWRSMVMRAVHAPSDKPVVLVLLDPRRSRALDAWSGIVSRTTIATQTTDPVLSRTWSLEDVEGVRFILCEDVRGPSIADELAAGLPMHDLPRAGRVVFELARAVAELQRLGTPHGGLFLDAVLVPRDSAVRLLQYPRTGDPHLFPLRLPLDGPEVARLGIRAASIAPELLATGGVCSEAADVYALGAILHVLVGAGLPNWRGSPEATFAAACQGMRPPDPGRLPQEVSNLLGYMLAPDPAWRYPTAFDAAQAIAACFRIAPLPAEAAMPPRTTPIPSGVPGSPLDLSGHASSAGLVDTTESNRPRTATRSRRRSPNPWVLSAIGGGIVLLTILGAAILLKGSRRPEQGKADVEQTAEAQGRKPPEDPAAGKPPEKPPAANSSASDGSMADGGEGKTSRETKPERQPVATVAIVDDPDVLWASPTHGPPPDFAYLPPGSQLVLTARLAEALTNKEGRRFLEALGPEVQKAVEEASSLAGVGPEGIGRLTAAWQADESGRPIVCYLIEANAPLDRTRLKAAWGQTSTKKVADETLHVGQGRAYCLPSSRGGQLLLAGPEAILERSMESGGMPMFTPDMEQFAGSLDDERHVVLFGSPGFLAADGRLLMTGPLAGLAAPLAEMLDESVRVAAVSIHFGPTFYAELSAFPSDRSAAGGLARTLAETIRGLPERIEKAVAALDPAPYGRTLVLRLPSMIRVVDAHLRHSAEGRLAIVNCHLPPEAGHNLALAAEIALQQSARPVASVAAAGPKAEPVADTAVARLQKKISLSFAKDTLEKSIQMISEEIGLPMEILGSDLQLEGITKNQSFGLDERNQTADAILRTILAKANSDGKLVYVLRNRDGVESLEVTTRAAAEKRKDKLPEGF